MNARHIKKLTAARADGGKQGLGVILVIIATVSLSTEAIAAKIAYANGVSVISALAFRYIIAAFLFWTGLLLLKYPCGVARQDMTKITILAVGGQATTVLLLFNAFRYIPAAIAILFLYLYPTIATFLAFLFLKEPLTKRKLVALTLTLGGCIFILGQPLHGLDMRGVAFSAGAAVTNALFLVGSTSILRQVRVPVYNAYMTAILAFLFSVIGLASSQLKYVTVTPTGWKTIIILGVICTVVALTALFQGVKYIGASRAAIISTFEPLATALLGIWLLQESLTSQQTVGGILVLAGVLLQRRE